jgi:hypothetical protein
MYQPKSKKNNECYVHKFESTLKLVGRASFNWQLYNKVSHKKLEKISYKLWKGRSPFYKYLKVQAGLFRKKVLKIFILIS